MSDGGKGSAPRPFSVTNEEYAARWDAIFSRDLDKKEAKSKTDVDTREAALQALVDENERLGLYK